MLNKIIFQKIITCALIIFSTSSLAQVEVVNPGLIDKYKLDLSVPGVDYSLEIGSQGALYLRDHTNNTLALISKTLTGQAAAIKGPGYFEASSDFGRIAYVSAIPNIVTGDAGQNEDVFVYDRSSGHTIRVEGLAAHNSWIDGLRLSPIGNYVAFLSPDINFGPTVGAHTNTRNERIYIYDIDQRQLSNVRYEGFTNGGSAFRLATGADNGDSFSQDGSKFFFYIEFFDGFDDSVQLYFNDIQTNTTTLIERGMGLGSLTIIRAATNSQFVYYSSSYDNFSNSTKSISAKIYNADTGLVTIPGIGGQDRWVHFAGTSLNRRYAIFYTTRYNQGYINDYTNTDHLDSEAGDIRVYDLQTAESRPAFMVNRYAKHLVDYDSVGINACSFVFVLSQAYLDQIAQQFPCTQFNQISDIDDYVSQSWNTFNLDTDKIQFHNNNRYITFDANAWYLDESIADNDFAIPYSRDSFVVVNPFLESINLVGQPDVDGSKESGVFIWRDDNGQTMVKVVAGDPIQNGQTTDYQGSITSGSVIDSLLPINLENTDSLNQVTTNSVEFDLITQRPWNDQFGFVADANEPLCVNLSNYAGNLYLGPDKMAVSPPYDIHALASCDSAVIDVEKLINNEARQTPIIAAQLSAGTLYKQSYKVTNNTPNRIYQVKVFEDGNLVCNFYSLESGQDKERCISSKTVLDGDQHAHIRVTAKASGSGQALTDSTDSYYSGLNVSGELRVTHRINNVNADSVDQSPTLGSSQATISYKVENTGEIELYQVKTYHDPVSPINNGWALQCVLGPLKPGQVRYCKRDITVDESGLNHVIGRVQGRNAIRSATGVVNASNPTYFIAP